MCRLQSGEKKLKKLVLKKLEVEFSLQFFCATLYSLRGGLGRTYNISPAAPFNLPLSMLGLTRRLRQVRLYTGRIARKVLQQVDCEREIDVRCCFNVR